MAETTPRVRPTGATSTLGRTGFPHIVSATGGEIDIVTGASQPGFNPIDLLYASLSACLAMSARIAAGKLGVLDRLEGVEAAVTGVKAPDEPSRVLRFEITMRITGDLDQQTRAAIAHMAEDGICTVSNTMKANPGFALTLEE
ncbi:ABC transporter ATP-binding protein [Xaviernesmea oryzae]|uniref:ABC transporter ATP-binding protein n=1 Tax=Xaviernesmea oryzae TaxID=464029 RepID=A0A1Q9AQR7_9HYPH|nr:OsmC family protein [Xaviernesmea oryzae]OLP57716.1 ABC transporter ATP-binding protein [Xaviernesmea oryzae]SEM05485.1 Uncharacterized OsmC-related protein [Xaviernesmea oryzae]